MIAILQSKDKKLRLLLTSTDQNLVLWQKKIKFKELSKLKRRNSSISKLFKPTISKRNLIMKVLLL